MENEIREYAEVIRRVKSFRDELFGRLSSPGRERLWLTASLKDIKKVVVIAGASRSGSSLLFSILRNLPGVYSPSGENVPFYKLNGLYDDSFSSDGDFPDGEVDIGGLERDLLSDLYFSSKEENPGAECPQDYIDNLLPRFILQWPAVNFSPAVFNEFACRAYRTSFKERGVFVTENFYLEFLALLRGEYPGINPYYYDILPARVKEKFPDLSLPQGPVNRFLTIEEAPFILLPPGCPPVKEELSENVLLLKSSVDCYRMDFLERIFPGAGIKIIYLTRNPFGSINGLYDGWLHRGFFSHNLSRILKRENRALEISGYSEMHDWGKWWWNYDLPPGWRNYTRKKLEEVCAFQWRSANEAVCRYLEGKEESCCRVKYEKIVGDFKSRLEEVGRIIDFMGLASSCARGLNLKNLPLVQATENPALYRWRKRKSILEPLLGDKDLAALGEALGYRRENIEEWL